MEPRSYPKIVTARSSRKAVTISRQGLVRFDSLPGGSNLPILITPSIEGVSLPDWLTFNRGLVEDHLKRNGGILFRDFAIDSPDEFEQVVKGLSEELLEYSYRSTPRSRVSGRIYTSTEYPDYQQIALHNEHAYARNWPSKIWFFCLQAPRSGGETPIADSRNVYQLISPEIRQRFEKRRVRYVRNYGSSIDLPWQSVFQTSDKSEVEEYCRKSGIEFTWIGYDRLRTTQVCQAVARHPVTEEKVWFNQAHLFHISGLQAEVRRNLLETFEEEDLPRNAYYGDGTPIDEQELDEIREAYRKATVAFQWRQSDVLLLDNMLVAHGRNPYEGPRRVLVGMTDLLSGEEI